MYMNVNNDVFFNVYLRIKWYREGKNEVFFDNGLNV